MKIDAKIMLSVTASTLLFSCLLIFYLVSLERDKEIKRLNDKITSTVQLFESSSIAPLWDIDRKTLTENLNAFLRDDEIISIRLRETSGAIDIRLDDNPGTGTRDNITKQVTIRKNGRVLGEGEMVFSRSILDGRLATIRNTMIWLTIASICFTALVTYSVAIVLLKPVKKIIQGLARVDGGDYSYTLKLDTRDEFNDIEQCFNRMVSTIAREIASRNAVTERLQIAIHATHIGIWDWNVVEDVLIWDDNFSEIYGTPHGDFTGGVRAWSKHLHPDDQSRVTNELQAALRGEHEYAPEFRIIRPDGSVRIIKANSQTFFDQNRKPIRLVGTNIDITERRRIEQEIRQLNAELEQRVQERTAQLTVANQELEAFSYSVSHDLRAPLRSIDGFSRILLEDCGDKLDDEGKDSLQRVRAASQRMGQLIDDLLQLSRYSRSELHRTTVNLSALARAVTDELQMQEPERRVTLVIAPGLQVSADPALMRVVLVNLLGNAWKFTGKQAAANIEFGRTTADGLPAFFVRDNGAGFDMTYADKLFGAFQRLHTTAEFPGTGIGLITVQRIIRRHGGSVWAESQVNHGATFYFTLPGNQKDPHEK